MLLGGSGWDGRGSGGAVKVLGAAGAVIDVGCMIYITTACLMALLGRKPLTQSDTESGLFQWLTQDDTAGWLTQF